MLATQTLDDSMPRNPDEVQVQLSVSPEMRQILGMTAIAHQKNVATSRTMDRGRMVVLVMEWFLALDREEQLRVLREGLEIADARGREATDKAVEMLDDALEAWKSPTPRKRGNKSVPKVHHPLPIAPGKGGKVEPGREDDAVRRKDRAPSVKKGNV